MSPKVYGVRCSGEGWRQQAVPFSEAHMIGGWGIRLELSGMGRPPVLLGEVEDGHAATFPGAKDLVLLNGVVKSTEM